MHQLQGKKSEERERDRGIEDETPNPFPANWCAHSGNAGQNRKQKKVKQKNKDINKRNKKNIKTRRKNDTKTDLEKKK